MASTTSWPLAELWTTRGSEPAAVLVVSGGEEIFHQDAPSRHAFLILEGLVKMTRGEQTGREVIVGLYQPGCAMGVASVILQRPYVGTAVSITRSRLREMSGTAFRTLLEVDPSFAREIYRLLSGEVYDGIVRIAGLVAVPARGRLEGLLRTLISAHEHESEVLVPLPIPLKQADLAQVIGVTREHLLRLLKQLELEGVLRRKVGRILIDPSRLS